MVGENLGPGLGFVFGSVLADSALLGYNNRMLQSLVRGLHAVVHSSTTVPEVLESR